MGFLVTIHSWRRAMVIWQRFATLWNQGLFSIGFRHFYVAPGKTRFDRVQQILMQLEWNSQKFRKRLPREIVYCRSESAGADHYFASGMSDLECFSNCGQIVTYDCFGCDLDSGKL